MGISTAERNKRKRERKKRQKQQQQEEQGSESPEALQLGIQDDEVVDYVMEEPILDDESFAEVKRFHKAAAIVSDAEEERQQNQARRREDLEDDEMSQDQMTASKRKLKEQLRPTVAELKRRVARPDLVEAHDISAPDPDFLLELKAVEGTVQVPRHWGRKRKYLQGKRGFEKPPFQLPEFILNTGIAELRDNLAEQEASMTARAKNRQRVAPKMGAIDVDYRTLHAAFFKHQTKPKNLTKFGDLYYEGKEMETNIKFRPGVLSKTLREALGMSAETAPPPWLINMQRYGPPPSFPTLPIPGLNAPLPNDECQYGFHPGGWGKPPVDAFGRPLYGGNPFDPPGRASNKNEQEGNVTLVTSDGKMIGKSKWGALPTGFVVDNDEMSQSSAEMEESSDEEEEDGAFEDNETILPPPPSVSAAVTGPLTLRKDAGDDAPSAPKQLYQILDQAKGEQLSDTVFASDVKYVIPGTGEKGVESVLAKAEEPKKRKRNVNDDEEEDIEKNFKF